MEGLTIVCCKMEPSFQTLGETVDGGILLPGLQKLGVYIGCGDIIHRVGEAPKLFRRGDECGR